MNKNNRNSWDARRPSLDRWWESAENQNNEMPVQLPTSPKAIQNTKQWIDRSLQCPGENIAVKTRNECFSKKSVST